MRGERKKEDNGWFRGVVPKSDRTQSVIVVGDPGIGPDEWQKIGRPNWVVSLMIDQGDGRPRMIFAPTNVPVCCPAVIPVESPGPVVSAGLTSTHPRARPAKRSIVKPVPTVNLPVLERVKLWRTGQRIAFADGTHTLESAQTFAPAGTDPSIFTPSGAL